MAPQEDRPMPRETSDFEMNRPTVISLLYLGSFLAGITTLIAVVLAYLWKGEAHESWEESHFRYAIRTFWIGIAWTIIGVVLAIVLIGWFILALIPVWFAIRALKSLVAAQRRDPVTNVESWIF
jgi:uncharacterized membrane protein